LRRTIAKAARILLPAQWLIKLCVVVLCGPLITELSSLTAQTGRNTLNKRPTHVQFGVGVGLIG
jgi:hypothetical protein